jgi:hypothetical protein
MMSPGDKLTGWVIIQKKLGEAFQKTHPFSGGNILLDNMPLQIPL